MISFVAGAALLAPSTSLAQTFVPSGTVYTSNVTWTAAGSPYVVGGLRVAAGATLTIGSGVVVKMSGQFTSLTVNGTITVAGSAANPVIITSVQDDSADGVDSGGDGATTGLPGQWYSIAIDAAGSYPSALDHADVRYGGYGSANSGYGALSVTTGLVTVTNSRLHDDQRSGVYVYGAGDAEISNSRIDHNGNGATAVGGLLGVSNSVIDHNSDTGIYYSYATTPSAQPAVVASRIADNATRGIWFNVANSIPGAKAPTGVRNNIFRNGTPNTSGIYPEQLYVLQGAARTDIDWTYNYWGTWGDGNAVNANECSAAVPPENPWHLAYGPHSTGGPQVAPGPVSFTTEAISWVWPGTFCGSDKVKDYPFSPQPHESRYIGTFSPLIETSIARGVRPFLKFDSGERWTPLLLEPFFAETDGDEGAQKFCPDPGSTANCTPLTSLAQWTSLAQADSDGFLNINDTSDYTPGYYASLYVVNGSCTPAWTGLLECGDAAHSALYYNLTTRDFADGYQTARSYWDYWWFYRFNDAPSSPFDHEGDWEGMTVVTPAALDPAIGPTNQILYVVYAQHSGYIRQLPGTYQLEQGTHPVGYPANGTHATYPTTCTSFCLNESNEPDGERDGTRSWSVNSCDSCLYALPEADSDPLADLQPTSWNAIRNQWGSTFNGTLNGASSPDAPGRHDRYLAPWTASGSDAPAPAFRQIHDRARARIGCGEWFGGAVIALLCDSRAATAANRAGILGGRYKGTYAVRLGQRGARYGSTFGLAQAVGRPLAAGAKLRLTGRIPRGVVLQVRTQVGRRLATVTFRLPSLPHGARGTLVRSATEQLAYTLVLSTNQRVRAVSVDVPS